MLFKTVSLVFKPIRISDPFLLVSLCIVAIILPSLALRVSRRIQKTSMAILIKMASKEGHRINPSFLAVSSLITIFLSTVAVEVGSKLPSSSRSSLRVRMGSGDALAGVLASALLAIGDLKKNPYFFIPWLVLSLRGFLSCEGPSLLGLGYQIIPLDGLPGGIFFFACAFLFVEELCVWTEVLKLFRWSWKIYMKRLEWERQIEELKETKASMTKFMSEISTRCKYNNL